MARLAGGRPQPERASHPPGRPPAARADDPPITAAASRFQRRWNLGWELALYVIIAAAAVLALLDPDQLAGEPMLLLALVAGSLGWHLWFVSLHPEWPENRLGPMAVYFVGLVGFGGLLSTLHPAFLLLAAGAYPMAFVVLPGRWAYAGILIPGASLTVLLGGLPPDVATVGQLAGSTLVVGAVGWAIRQLESEAELRRQTSEELERALLALRTAAREQDRLRSRMLAREREAAVTAERARMAGELHDTLAQGLAGITTQLEIAEELVAEEHPARRRIGSALTLARSSLVEARRSVHDLRPGPLLTAGLGDALHTVVDEWRTRTGGVARLRITGDPEPADPAVDRALLRATQESLANIEKHAAATEVTVTLSYLGDLVAVDIVDDGVGFDADHLGSPGETGGHGLSAMRDRVAAVQGRLAVESRPGEGTMINATIPLRPGIATSGAAE
ncbi:signal transduction histidine kinase [Actinoalloteichus hoggarensis]|uniref:Signal transduction histidine-protein kinase/phosphatase DegS n=1 Tax=Actinoalloteichus hoggarensis TaxID=1470176 RepID=A0A221VXM6_9PSEU|nr:sensor histidine kinase [Actinoalloteichus hoggarensis]ASO18309.1 Signal transduction histidine-protein kinase/phosphatase DegS [Actinoalloteichus hoggarensis]MBB5921671.1 signal transduction histidine kinase [Actinoalloteichus hoggarensis]